MFTGLIADLGAVLAVERGVDGAALTIRTSLADALNVGDSIAVNGVCLTATRVRARKPSASSGRAGEGRPADEAGESETGACEGAELAAGESEAGGFEGGEFEGGELAGELEGGEFEAQAIPETLARTTLGGFRQGDAVNLELALRADGRLGGHIVQGHVDGVGVIAEARADGGSRVLAVDADPALLCYVVEKGSIAIDGVSLTVSALRESGFEVSLIPETLQRTTLGQAAVGRAVNLEADILAKHLQRLMEAHT